MVQSEALKRAKAKYYQKKKSYPEFLEQNRITAFANQSEENIIELLNKKNVI